MVQYSFPAQADWKYPAVAQLDQKNPVLGAVGEWCQCLADSCPRVYLLTAAVLALAGYLYLLVFPVIVLRSAYGIHEVLIKSQTLVWSHLGLWVTAGMVSFLVSRHLIQFRPAVPRGILLDRNAAPSLFQLIAEQVGYYKSTPISRIVLTGNFEIDIVKTPRWAFPPGSTSTLVIGLPLIECLSLSRFQCALARRIGQFSKRHNWLVNALYQLREVWPRYCEPRQYTAFGYLPVRWFFSLYAPLFRVLTLPAARLDELAADNYAMQLFSDEDVLDTITAQMVCDRYLAEEYWPVMQKILADGSDIGQDLQSGMVSLLRKMLESDRASYWLARTVSAKTRWDDATPSLAERAENIGHTRACMSMISAQSAASVYLAGLPGESNVTSGNAMGNG